MEYYNEFKLTMETNAKAKEASEILINRLNKTSLDKGTQRKTTENELPSLTQCTA